MTSLAPASRPLVLVDRVFPRSVVTNILLVLAGTGLVALCAQIIIPMVPVPITMQTFAVLFVGTVLGPARGAVALALYLVLGVAGLPIFAGGTSGNLFALSSGGYIVGFVAAAVVVGWLANLKWDRHVLKTLISFLAGTVVIYAFGLPWLYFSLQSYGEAVWSAYGDTLLVATLMAGLVPFLIGDALKALLAAGLLPGTWKLLGEKRKPRA
jgi:biotin transport system substrate-specific component